MYLIEDPLIFGNDSQYAEDAHSKTGDVSSNGIMRM